VKGAWEMEKTCAFHEITERRLNDHGDRIRALEIKDAAQTERLDALCTKLDELSKSIKELIDFWKTAFWKVLGVAGTIISVLVGFFIWYVQRIGG
jgi:hypothetical protein